MKKRQHTLHDVVIRLAVDSTEVPRAAAGFPAVEAALLRKFGPQLEISDLSALPVESEERRCALALILSAGIGGNEMNGLDVEDLSIEVDGDVLIDQAGGVA